MGSEKLGLILSLREEARTSSNPDVLMNRVSAKPQDVCWVLDVDVPQLALFCPSSLFLQPEPSNLFVVISVRG